VYAGEVVIATAKQITLNNGVVGHSLLEKLPSINLSNRYEGIMSYISLFPSLKAGRALTGGFKIFPGTLYNGDPVNWHASIFVKNHTDYVFPEMPKHLRMYLFDSE